MDIASCRTGFPDLVSSAQALANKLKDSKAGASHNVENLMLSATMDMIGGSLHILSSSHSSHK